MNCNRVERLLDAYLDGELDGQSMLQIQDHLRSCERCHDELKEIRRMKHLVARTMSLGALPGQAPTDLEERLLAACRSQIGSAAPNHASGQARRGLRMDFPTFFGFAAAAAVATFAFLAMVPKSAPQKTPETAPIAFEIQRDQIYSVGLDPMAGSPTISTTHGIVP
jgi:anti-sigma factor RsiW